MRWPLGRVTLVSLFLLLCFFPRHHPVLSFKLCPTRRLRILARRLGLFLCCPSAHVRPPVLVRLCRLFTPAAVLLHWQPLRRAPLRFISSTTWTSRCSALLVTRYEWTHVGEGWTSRRTGLEAPGAGRDGLVRGSLSAASRPSSSGRVVVLSSWWRTLLPTQLLPQGLLDWFCLMRVC